MSLIKGREIPTAIVAFAMIVNLIEYYIDIPAISSLATLSRNWAIVISAFAVGIGIIALLSPHMQKIQRKETDWPFSVYMIALMIIMIAFGLIGTIGTNPTFSWLYKNAQLPIVSATNSLLGLFIFSAAFRAFRARNIEASLMLIAAIFVMLGNAPIGASLWNGFPVIKNWLYDIPNAAGMRAIIIGAAIGVLIIGIRTLFGLKRR